MFPRAVVTVPGLTEHKECLDDAVRHRVGSSGCSVQGQDLDLMILVGPPQIRIFHNSVILWPCPVVSKVMPQTPRGTGVHTSVMMITGI